jgi:hypothetical protein
MASRMLHGVSVSSQQDLVLLGCDHVIVCTVAMLCSSIVYSSSRGRQCLHDRLMLKVKTLCSFEVLLYTQPIKQRHILTDWTVQ